MDTTQIAGELLDAYDRGRAIPSVVDRTPGFDWDEAYAVAAEIVKMRRARGEKTVGRKIGFTNRNIWAEYGAIAPIWAHVYEGTLVHAQNNCATLSLRGSVQPRIELEIALKLAAPVPVGCNDPGVILRCVEWYAPSFELVDCHFTDWKFKPADSAADFSFHWRLVVGTPRPVVKGNITTLVAQLRDCRVTLAKGEQAMDRGAGSNALDHPALALAFLADIVARQPSFEPLSAGEVITTGTLTAALPVAPGQTWRSDYAGLDAPGLTLTFIH
jgi:2-oxo-3-hexenedioate decarboxylase